jgi:hypothetical protein
MSAIRLKNTGRYKVRPPAQSAEISAENIKTVLRVMDREVQHKQLRHRAAIIRT